MARTHPFAETGARPKPHATEGVTLDSMPPAKPAVEDEMLAAAAPSAIGRRLSVPKPPGEQFALRSTQVREIAPRVLPVVAGSLLPAARLTRFLASLPDVPDDRAAEVHLCRRRSRATGDATHGPGRHPNVADPIVDNARSRYSQVISSCWL